MECEGGVDRISKLPDDVIVHILSFLTLKNATVTSILSTRWLDLWKYTPYLKFQPKILAYGGLQPERKKKYINWVNSVIKLHKAFSLKEFSISTAIDKSSQLVVTKWLEFAFSRRVKRLELDFQVAVRPNAGVLDEILRKSSIQSCDFKSLKELKLTFIKVGGEAIQLFLRNCPLLEQLIILGAVLMSDIVIFGQSLKHVDIRKCCRLNSIKVSSAPNLTWLKIEHVSQKLFLENVPKLVRMDFTCRHSDTMHDFANTARHLETLSIKLHYPKSKEFSVPIMPTLKKLILYYREVHKDVLLPITCLIEAAPCLEEFKFEIIELDRKKGIFEVPKVGRFVHHHLKKFDFAGFCVDAPDHMELVKYVVNNCVALQSMTLVTQFMRRILNGRGVTVRDEEEEAFKLNARQAMRGLKGIVPRHITLFYGHLSCDATGKLMP